MEFERNHFGIEPAQTLLVWNISWGEMQNTLGASYHSLVYDGNHVEFALIWIFELCSNTYHERLLNECINCEQNKSVKNSVVSIRWKICAAPSKYQNVIKAIMASYDSRIFRSESTWLCKLLKADNSAQKNKKLTQITCKMFIHSFVFTDLGDMTMSLLSNAECFIRRYNI